MEILVSKEILKNIDEDKRLFTAVVLEPEVYDAHNHIYSEDVIMEAAHDYMDECLVTNLQHQIEVTKKDISIVESWIAPIDMEISGQAIKRGSWLATAKVHNDEIWKAVKDGVFKSFSIGCRATFIEENED